MLSGQIGITRNLLEHRIEFGRSGRDPLQIFVIQHKGMTISGLVAIVPTCPENATENGKNSDRERTDCEHERVFNVSTVHAPSRARSQSESVRRLTHFVRWTPEKHDNSSSMTFRNGFYAGLLIAVIWALYLARLWQGPRQVELHSIHLLAQIEKKDWKAVGEFISNDYQDRWGNDRALLLER